MYEYKSAIFDNTKFTNNWGEFAYAADELLNKMAKEDWEPVVAVAGLLVFRREKKSG